MRPNKTMLKYVISLTLLYVIAINQEVNTLSLAKHSPHEDPELRIVHGQEAVPHSVPYAVALLYPGGTGKVCSASLISSNYVMTAAHCLTNKIGLQVVLGAHDSFVNESTQIRLEVTAAAFKINANFNPTTLAHDIAVIKLPRPIGSTQYIQPVKLPQLADASKVYASGRAYGWGITEFGQNTKLRYADIDFKGNPCLYSSSDVCSTVNGGPGLCSGDSGGPLVNLADGVQFGINSYVTDDCKGQNGFASVNHYLHWLKGVTDAIIN